MDEQLHEALDANLAPHEVSPEIAASLDDARALFAGVVRSIPLQPIPDLGASVLRRIEQVERVNPSRIERAPHTRRSTGLAVWLWSPHTVSLSIRPAYALAAAIVFAIGIGVGTTQVNRLRTNPAVPTAGIGNAQVLVHFRFAAPQAKTVMLAGDFSNWAPAHAMQRSKDGVWTIVVPLTPGVHEYAFIVDGTRWVSDPEAPASPDGFGGMNSRLAVLGPDRRS